MDDPEGMGRRLKAYILERRMAMGYRTEADLLRSMKPRMVRGTLNGYYHGNNISPAAGERLATALGVTYRDLLDVREGIEVPARPSGVDWALVDAAADRFAERFWERYRRETAGQGDGVAEPPTPPLPSPERSHR